MFNGKKRLYSRKSASVSLNAYNEELIEYITENDVLMFISLSSEFVNNSNDMRINQCSHIGLTNDDVTIDDLIDDKYTVTFINKTGRENIVYMKEVESDGCFI